MLLFGMCVLRFNGVPKRERWDSVRGRRRWSGGGGRVNGWASKLWTKEAKRAHRRIDREMESVGSFAGSFRCLYVFENRFYFFSFSIPFRPFVEPIATFFTLFSSLLVLYFVRWFAHSDILYTYMCIEHGIDVCSAHKTTHDPFRTETDKICVLCCETRRVKILAFVWAYFLVYSLTSMYRHTSIRIIVRLYFTRVALFTHSHRRTRIHTHKHHAGSERAMHG